MDCILRDCILRKKRKLEGTHRICLEQLGKWKNQVVHDFKKGEGKKKEKKKKKKRKQHHRSEYP